MENIVKDADILFLKRNDDRTGGALSLNKEADTASETAKILVDSKAVLCRPKHPFTLVSGRKSPVYVNCRAMISYPEERSKLMSFMEQSIREKIGVGNFDVIAGGETAGIPYAAILAERLNKPMIYVRKESKKYGMENRIEGRLNEGQRVLLIEDHSTDGQSKISFINAIREQKAQCSDCFVIFFYGIFSQAEENLKKQDIKIHSLATWHDVMKYISMEKLLSEDDYRVVKNFLDNPE